MHLLIVIGAGASFDCWPKHIPKQTDFSSRIPLANNLFSPLPIQNQYLESYNLMGLAGKLRNLEQQKDKEFDIEAELANISDVANARNDANTIQNLLKARFYLQAIITKLTEKTIRHTSSHTVYIDLLNKLKDWIDESPISRYVDIVVFNYDNLIEKAMEHVYSVDWYSKNSQDQLTAYYRGKNLRIYKPHGSINWGREVINIKNGELFNYNEVQLAFNSYSNLQLLHTFKFINPDDFMNLSHSKNFIPAIAVPFKNKNNFDECPQHMQYEMLQAVNNADKIITLGWKGAEKHFTNLIKTNGKIDRAYIISPKAETYLKEIFTEDKIHPFESTFSHFISESTAFESLLNTFDNK